MEEILKNASLLAAVIALAFVIVGLLQWAVSLTKNADTRRQELFKQIEEAKLENARLKGQLIMYSDKLTDLNERLKDYKARYAHFKELYEATQIPHDHPGQVPPANPPKPPDMS